MMSQSRLGIWSCLAVTCCLFATLESRAFQNEKKVTAEADALKIFNSEFVEITPGQGAYPKTVEMGSATGSKDEQPPHQVTLTKSFFIAKYEVPQNLYMTVTGKNPSRWKGRRNSAEMMTFGEAVHFCKLATVQMRDAKLIGADDEIRLPTEAEWEYCCRAGTKTAYSFGDKVTKSDDQPGATDLLNAYAWHTGNAAGNDPEVGILKPNAWGLYDMHGYLWEYVADEWHNDYQGAPVDGSSWISEKNGGEHVVRGGSWKDAAPKLRSSARRKVALNEKGDDEKGDEIGFRCVKAKVR
jgi:formylglycine-generating enzyme required for sulfatase activity